jgi:hypothetical protein
MDCISSFKRRQHTVRATATALLLLSGARSATAFLQQQQQQAHPTFITPNRRVLFSSVGGRPPSDSNGDRGKGEYDDFFDPLYEESEELIRAKEYMSENSLPISFDSSNDENQADATNIKERDDQNSSALVALLNDGGEMTHEMISNNPYMAVVSKLSPSELISKFTKQAHPRVQNAVRQTILGLIGGLPKMAFDTKTVTTGQRLASLMFQLQMTGYMFKNADYRLSIQQSLQQSDAETTTSQLLLNGGSEKEKIDPIRGKIKGKLRIRLGGRIQSDKLDATEESETREYERDGDAVTVDAAAYMSELRSEVSALRDELGIRKKEKEETLRKDLLMYIRTLPEKELQGLTSTMSQEVLVAMKGLVNAVLTGIGEGQIRPDTVTEQSGEAMAQLCMWQLAIGYNLRTLEVREEMKKSLAGSKFSANVNDEFDGAFE